MRNMCSIVAILLLFPACTKVKIGPEFSSIKKDTKDRTGSTAIMLNNILYQELADIPHIETIMNNGLSQKEAIEIALFNNPELQAHFQNLGIAKADLAQAGLFTNPNLDSVFRFPTKTPSPGLAQTNIESTLSFRLSDLWQVPFNKQVAEDVLEVVSFEIIEKILSIIAHVKIAYDNCLAAEQQLINTKNLFDITQQLKDEIYYRYNYGYTTDMDKDFADAQVAMHETQLKQRTQNVDIAYLQLYKMLGINPRGKAITLVNNLFDLNMIIPPLETLEEFVTEYHPMLHIARLRVQRYKDAMRVEKAKILNNVDVGVSFKQDFEKPFRGWGPYINFELPIFDTNYAQISRTEFLLRQAEYELGAVTLEMKKRLKKLYAKVITLQQEIALYEKIIVPSHQQAIDYAYTYAETMQLNMVTALNAQIKWWQVTIALTNAYYEARKKLAKLEYSVSKNLALF